MKNVVILPSQRINSNEKKVSYFLDSSKLDSVETEKLFEFNTWTIPYLGIKIDRVALVLNFIMIAILLLIWKYTGFFNLISKSNPMLIYIVFITIILLLNNILEQNIQTGDLDLEIKIMKLIEQMASILFGLSMISVVFGLARLCKTKPYRDTSHALLIFSSCFLALINMYYTSKDNNIQYNRIRKIKQSLLTLSVILIIITIILVFSDYKS